MVVCVALSAAPQSAGPRSAARQDMAPQPLALIEYSDFQCPFAAAGQPIVERVLAVFGNSVTYEYRHHVISSHPMAPDAARWYEALREHDPKAATFFRQTLFANQTRLANEGIGFLREVVRRSGQDPTLIGRESKSPIIEERLASHAREAKEYKLGGTPGYVVEGATLDGPSAFAKFETMLCDRLRQSTSTARPVTSPGESDCWALLNPDWNRLADLETGKLVAPLKPMRVR
jgi:protein-disulfide isomerase